MENKNLLLNFLAFFTIVVWGTTFVSTKVLLSTFTPAEIMFLRFSIAYIMLLLIHPKFYKITSLKEEALFLLAGITGGSLYFLTENSALIYSLTSNVALILATAPILTAFMAHFFSKGETLNKNLFIGFIIAILGVFLVIFNGNFILKLNPLGDILALSAALCWAIYSVTLKKISGTYNYIYVTRKMFFYALLTILPFILFSSNNNITLLSLSQPKVIFNLLFLGVIASGVCYVVWNYTVDNLGIIKTNNYIYLIPAVTMIASFFILNESITLYSTFGAILVLLGVYVSENGFKLLKFKQSLH
ncbi:multidrug transporter [Clostridium botulinum]|uniref:DMT family transporter n=1 Tax=Clostridium botulinum TaxID=1491 RepID=UPI000174EA49|nr:DMT family transporter [Clostridium botulinum]ACD54058.1 UAA transporter family [Clostridium botulinum E3 str. Alaska E43]AJF29293.1 multidrug transporter [Clostridium botulinum]AJF32354.1 multidrug transporter [Clostridium botulinum]MBY6789574.1 DMT family transporter [Clostridium botulinum]MBY6817257.1 DMT family transporter [Clostridium botulinum]